MYKLYSVGESQVKQKSKLHYDRQSVGQSILVSGTHLGPVTNWSILFIGSCGFFFMWGALSDEGTGL
jgi:hypothetical protein